MRKKKVHTPRIAFSPHISRIFSAGVIILLLIQNLMPPSAKERAETNRKQEALSAATAKYASVSGEIMRWEQISARNPGYRDGYLKLAVGYWQIFENDRAKNLWQKAFNLDPNNEEVVKIKQALQF